MNTLHKHFCCELLQFEVYAVLDKKNSKNKGHSGNIPPFCFLPVVRFLCSPHVPFFFQQLSLCLRPSHNHVNMTSCLLYVSSVNEMLYASFPHIHPYLGVLPRYLDHSHNLWIRCAWSHPPSAQKKVQAERNNTLSKSFSLSMISPGSFWKIIFKQWDNTHSLHSTLSPNSYCQSIRTKVDVTPRVPKKAVNTATKYISQILFLIQQLCPLRLHFGSLLQVFSRMRIHGLSVIHSSIIHATYSPLWRKRFLGTVCKITVSETTYESDGSHSSHSPAGSEAVISCYSSLSFASNALGFAYCSTVFSRGSSHLCR